MTGPDSATELAAGPGYRAAREGAAVLDRSARVRLEFSGPQAAATLNGLVTNDVAALAPGAGHLAAALTAKGKVIADVRIFAREGSLLVDADAAAAPALLAMLRKFVNPRFATFRDVSGETCAIGLFGPRAAAITGAMAGVSPDTLAALAHFAHVRGRIGDADVDVVRAPDLGVPGFELVAPAAAARVIVDAAHAAGAAALDASSTEVLRVEAGRPRYGVDFDENQLAQEAGFDRLGAISFSKGCYTGQETVARVHFRGHVNRTLRGLRARAPLARGAGLLGAGRAAVGDVRSAAHSPVAGHIALAYVRREVADGDTVTVAATSGECAATVVALPFALD